MKRFGQSSARARALHRGIALFTTLVIMFFLLVLTGALVQTQAGAFATARLSDDKTRARAASRSVYDYCLYQIEHQRNWGAAPFSGLEELDPPRKRGSVAHLGDRVQVSRTQGRTIFGYLPEHHCSFRVSVTNALTSPSELDGVPAEQIELRIETWPGESATPRRGEAQTARAMLRLAPLYDASILTRGSMSIDAQHMFLASKDPLRNELRAEGDASMPGLLSGRTRYVDYEPGLMLDSVDPASVEVSGKGLLWSTGKIFDGGSALEGEELGLASRRTGARLVEESPNRMDVYDLKPENLSRPGTDSADSEVRIPPGEYRFTKSPVAVEYESWEPTGFGGSGGGESSGDDTPGGGSSGDDSSGDSSSDGPTYAWVTRVRVMHVDALHYFSSEGESRPDTILAAPPPMGRLTPGGQARNTRMALMRSHLDDPLEALDSTLPPDPELPDFRMGERFALQEPAPGTPASGIRRLTGSQDSPVVIDLKNQSFVVKPQTRVTLADGPTKDFHLTSEPNQRLLEEQVSLDEATPTYPSFAFGNDGNDVSIEAQGDITLGKGVVTGLGTVISRGGDVNIQSDFPEIEWVRAEVKKDKWEWIARKRVVTVDPQEGYEGLVVYAGKDVNIDSSSKVDWSFRGFVYARQNFNFHVGGNRATFYGSVIAGKDKSMTGDPSLRITEAERLAFIYDPEYLKLMTKNLPHNWTRVERLFWSEN